MAKKKERREEEIEELKRRVKKLEEEKAKEEKKAEKIEEKPEREKESIVGSVIGGIIPGLGKIVKTLEKASPEFKERIAETDEQIRSNLAKGLPRKPHIEYGYSIRTLGGPVIRGSSLDRERLIREVKREEEPRIMLIWEKTPPVERKDIKIYPVGKKLVIKIKGKLYKEIALPFYVKKIDAKYEKGKKESLLCIKVEKR